MALDNAFCDSAIQSLVNEAGELVMRGDRVIRNGFGSGCQTERIDAIITGSPLSTEEIARTAGQTVSRVSRHCAYWADMNLFYGRTPEGKYYRLPTGAQPGKPSVG